MYDSAVSAEVDHAVRLLEKEVNWEVDAGTMLWKTTESVWWTNLTTSQLTPLANDTSQALLTTISHEKIGQVQKLKCLTRELDHEFVCRSKTSSSIHPALVDKNWIFFQNPERSKFYNDLVAVKNAQAGQKASSSRFHFHVLEIKKLLKCSQPKQLEHCFWLSNGRVSGRRFCQIRWRSLRAIFSSVLGWWWCLTCLPKSSDTGKRLALIRQFGGSGIAPAVFKIQWIQLYLIACH